MRMNFPLPVLGRMMALAILLLPGAGVTPTAAARPTATAQCRTFAETNQQVCDRFLEYWTQNGGLERQGLPISTVLRERSDVDGRTYSVQYFERAVFEAHPENSPPYDVLLSLLGVAEYNRRYAGAAPAGQRAGTGNAMRFPETGRTLAGRFRAYWEANGGLAQFGYPISDEFEEQSALDGKRYLVQYFERAVFEFHPENRPPFDVLLSLLGRFAHERKNAPSATPGVAPSPTAAAGALRAGQGRWLSKAPIPTPRSEVAVAEVAGKIHVLGGYSAQGQQIHEVYDPAADRWRRLADLPRPLNHAGAAGVGGKLYLIGGYTSMGSGVDTVYEYDPAADRWRQLASMPTARGALGVAVLGGKIYAVGGRDDVDLKANEVYDPASNRWSKLADMPTARDHLAVAELGGKIYAVAGRFETFARNTAVNEVYDPAADSWERRADLPTPRSGIAAVALAGHLLVFGGEATAGTFEENEAYNPATDRWVALAPMPTARHGIGAAVVGGVVYIPSGGPTPGGSQTEVHEAFTLDR